MKRRQRVVAACRVQFEHMGEPVTAVSEDIGKHGIFVRTDRLLPVGDVVELTVLLPNGSVMSVISRVAHILPEKAARVLGREPGMGFEFLEQDKERKEQLHAYLEDLITELTPPPAPLPTATSVLVVEGQEPLRKRLENLLGDAGFEVRLCANGEEALKQCQERRPHIVLASMDLEGMDGFALVKALFAQPPWEDLPVVLMAHDDSDMTRLEAYRLGVQDFIPMPFTDEELALRLRRIASSPRERRAILRGDLKELPVPTLLSLIDFERKSGVLAILRDDQAARLFFQRGHVVKAEGPIDGTDVKTKILTVMDWDDGNFEFTSGEVNGEEGVDFSVAPLLLEHARLKDEEARSRPPTVS